MNKRQEINKKIDEIALTLTGPDGDFSLVKVVSTLAKFYFEHPDFHSAHEAATNDVEKWDECKRPKDLGAQGNLFNADAIIPTGSHKGDRVFMKDAKREHLIGWRSIELEAFSQTAMSHAKKIAYIDSRLKVWNINGHATLGEVERDNF
jgi:hypothetical protein